MTMKRAPVVLTATAAGLAATVGFHAHVKGPAGGAVAAASTPATAASSSKPATASPSSTSSSKSSASKPSAAGKSVTGGAISTRYGNVQVKVTTSGGKILSVTALQLPQNDPKSNQISSYAEPQLRQSALTKQSALVDAVSGATYTSDGYRSALQSALDKARFQAAASTSAG
jgi:uncharacterized protein with FMN-binding domain